MAYLLNYTRLPINSELYDPKLAYSMHLAISEDGKEYKALNHNSGVLFLKATENENGSLNPKSLKNPFLFQLNLIFPSYMERLLHQYLHNEFP